MSEQIALGFCNNVDYEIIWDADIIADLTLRHRIGAGEPDSRITIQTERDLIVSILGFMGAGEGGERFVSGSDIIERLAARFEKKVTLGGTSVRAAIAMQKLGYASTLHLITQNEDVRRLLPPGCPYVCSGCQPTPRYFLKTATILIPRFGGSFTARSGRDWMSTV